MQLYDPCIILVPDTSLSSADASLAKTRSPTSILVQYVQEEFPNVPIEPIARKYWDAQAGDRDDSPPKLKLILSTVF
jgi:DNA mismatch repair protein MSH4